jgi:hypothetical protein
MVSKASDDFPAPAQTGDHRQRVARNFHVDILQIVLPRTMHGDFIEHKGLLRVERANFLL